MVVIKGIKKIQQLGKALLSLPEQVQEVHVMESGIAFFGKKEKGFLNIEGGIRIVSKEVGVTRLTGEQDHEIPREKFSGYLEKIRQRIGRKNLFTYFPITQSNLYTVGPTLVLFSPRFSPRSEKYIDALILPLK